MGLILPEAVGCGSDPRGGTGLAGVKLEGRKLCADHYEVSDALEKVGIHVRYMGEELTRYLETGREVLVF